MATRATRNLSTTLLRQLSRRDVTELTMCRQCRLRSRGVHTGTHPSPKDAPRAPPVKLSKPHRPAVQARAAPFGLLVGGGLVASALAYSQSVDEGARIEEVAAVAKDERDPSLPRFRLSDIRKHGASSGEPWVTYEDKVYNITDWVAAHPGGDVILRAAGASIEPYWNIFTIHKAPHVREILQQYLIGFIDVEDLGPDGRPATETIEDPFVSDPVRDPRLITHTAKPRNAEPPNEELDRAFHTPNGLFYVRHHMWVPVVEETKAEQHTLSIELPDGETKQYTLEDLKSKFPVHKVTAVLQCSGNRRNDMTRHAGKTNGLQWGVGAISNAEWEGVRLSDILADAGLKVLQPTSPTRKDRSPPQDEDQVDANAMHVQFTGLEAYGASIPLAKALDPRGDVLLAFGMNGEALPRDHGFPLRAVVPGHVAARSVKWLSKIVISDEESTSQWQRRDYKAFGPNEGANPDWDRAKSIQEMPVTSAITGVWVGDCVRRGRVPWMGNNNTQNQAQSPKCSSSTTRTVDIAALPKKIGITSSPTSSTTPANEPVAAQGYAYSGGGRAISRVDVSLDGGQTWDQAELVNDCTADPNNPCHGNKAWAWTRWRYVGALPALALPTPDAAEKKEESSEECDDQKVRRRKHHHQQQRCTTLVVKATDDAYNTQPESHRGIYNVRGNLATAWHRVRICPRCTTTGGGSSSSNGGVTWSTGETYGCGFRKEADEVGEGMRKSGVGSGEGK
ncbi:mitochondrial sulfite oxidase [Dichotomopilus funicola]|uniref:Nitrate reductase [NADPH] n=1 Tax=Dichotomopilus funicola TaxID=1934379 RepID=A0AAN6UYA8_9PEZI|nr:mitochondrial sulfite oxidase [Dichotomopilus funicola]